MKEPTKHKKTLVFKVFSISLPFVLLAILELTLQIFGFGVNYELFKPYDVNGEYLVFNEAASRKYFNDSQFATTGNKELFKKKKDENAFRIFVLGESTTIGYPYFNNGSFHRWLQYRLMQSYSDRNFEIINLSLTAVNSYTVLGFSKEVINFEPDAVIIYTGHNEYYGALGVGSTQLIGSSPRIVNSILTLRELRIVQLVTEGYNRIIKSFVENDVKTDNTRMELMVAERQIPLKSILYQNGIHQFGSNMNKALALFDSHDIPVFIGNLVSNEKDLPPFISASVNSEASKVFAKNFALGERALKKHDSLVALEHFKIANTAFSEHAMCNFYIGELIYEQKKYDKAKAYFEKSKELDQLRFRAPDTLNTIIDRLAAKYSNTYLVNVKNEFENNVDSRIIGEESVIDHVHPNLKGYALMSNAFYKSLENARLIPESLKKTEISFEKLLEEMPISKVDSIVGAYRIHILKESWPYNESGQKEKITSDTYEQNLAVKLLEKRISWRQVNDSLYAYYNQTGRPEKARKIAEALALEYAEDPVFYDKVGMLSGQLQKPEKAIFYITKSFHLRPEYDKAQYLLIQHLKMDQPIEAMCYLDYAISNTNTNTLELNRLKVLTGKAIILKEQIKKNPSDVKIQNEMAQVYLQMENIDGALKYIELVLAIDPKNHEATSMKNILRPI